MKSVHLVGCVKRDIMRWVKKYSAEDKYDLSEWYCGITHQDDLEKLNKYLSDNNINALFFRRWLSNDLNASYEILSFYIKHINFIILSLTLKFLLVMQMHQMLQLLIIIYHMKNTSLLLV